MEIGIGLPNAIPGATREQLVDWARAAEQAGFSSLSTIDRIAYDTYESIVALSIAATVTDRIRLQTAVLLGPVRVNPALLAKQALSVDAAAGGGRFVLGIGIGGREDDYAVGGQSMSTRGEWMDEALPLIRRIWNGEGEEESKVGPPARGAGPGLLIGGGVDASFRRAARYGDGWVATAGPPEQFADGLEKLKQAWEEHGRDGEPQTAALAYFSLGPDAQKDAERGLGGYYAYLGDEIAKMIVDAAAKDVDSVQGYIEAFESAGCQELLMMPASSDPGQVELLAEAASQYVVGG
jgi:alkanesulfonate monooxygenase SsuD/methylene tetrahydromethanopterin reductase-like flavin-dependent oxidoreductase (luciferase family)